MIALQLFILLERHIQWTLKPLPRTIIKHITLCHNIVGLGCPVLQLDFKLDFIFLLGMTSQADSSETFTN